MMRSTLLVVLTSILFVGCGKSETSSATSGGSTSTQPATTNPSEGALFVPPNAPNVGIRPATLAEYKPVVGKYGGRLIRDTLGEPKSFNPVTVGETSTSEYTNRMFQGMTELNPYTGEARPSVAEKWEVAADGLTWTFHLKKDVTFNDGSPLTAHDVAFSFNDLVYDNQRPPGKEPRW